MMSLASLSKPGAIIGLQLSEAGLLIFGAVLIVGIVGELKLPYWSHRLKRFERLVLIGVLGEFLADGGISLFSMRLQVVSDSEAAVLNNEAGQARKDAALVALKAGQANERAGRAIERAGRLERENLQLQKQLSPRRVTQQQREQLKFRVCGIEGKGRLRTTYAQR